MNFNSHYNLIGQHAFLGASKYHWINYTDEKIAESYMKALAIKKGTEDHEFACRCIKRKQHLPDLELTLNMYVNDCINFGMTPEQVLYYSDCCFGTADAISFDGSLLSISDLKTGSTKASMSQLLVYVALFCLEYGYDPDDIMAELRIYQNNTVETHIPSPDLIRGIMHKIVTFDRIITELKMEVG